MEFMQKIEIGLNAEELFRVDEQCTAGYVGSGGLDVLATPSLVSFVERVAYYLLQEQLPAGYSNVGSMLEVRHLSPTPTGMDVRVSCVVTAVDGRRVKLAFEAWDDVEKICEGRHERVVIDVTRFLQKLASKQASG